MEGPGAGGGLSEFEEVLFRDDDDAAAEAARLPGYIKGYKHDVENIRRVIKVYSELGQRKRSDLPLSLEVDQLFNYIRKVLAKGDAWDKTDELEGEALLDNVRRVSRQFVATEWPHFDEVADHYKRISKYLGTVEAIDRASEDELWEGILVVNAFSGRLGRMGKDFEDAGAETLHRFGNIGLGALGGNGQRAEAHGACPRGEPLKVPQGGSEPRD